jgi:hypothetical protein
MWKELFPGEAVTLATFRPGESMPPQVGDHVTSLFVEFYYRYHYLTKITGADRFRIVASIRGRICGFCTIEPVNGYGVLSSLLVLEAAQGRGIGGLMEDKRLQICLSENLIPYSSCVTVGLQSQRLKMRRQMLPINVKFGYRRDVFKPEDISSAVTFVARVPLPRPVNANAVKIDNDNNRIRIIARDLRFLEAVVDDLEGDDNSYIDVLASPDLSDSAFEESDLVFHGLDIQVHDRVWGYLWQIRNAVYRQGAAVRNDIVMPVEQILASGRSIASLSPTAA